MAEYIEREQAIAAIKKDVMGGLNYQSILNSIPSADVQPVKHGQWEILFAEEISDCIADHCRCTKCGLIHTFVDKHYNQYNWCPQCGARMDGDKNG